MPKSRTPEREQQAVPADGRGSYFHWSRMPAMGLFSVLPLWLLYIGLRWQLAPDERNGAEVLLLQQIEQFGERGHLVVTALFAILIMLAARSLMRHRVPWLRVAAVIVLEGLVYGVMLGPVAAALTSSANRLLSAGASGTGLVSNLVGSIGAGVFEELVFRLGLMSLLVWLGVRFARGWSVHRSVVAAFAVVASALVFSWFHHACGEPFDRSRFLFRTMAGVLLGVLMFLRGYGVCVYTHTVYNVYFYLRP